MDYAGLPWCVGHDDYMTADSILEHLSWFDMATLLNSWHAAVFRHYATKIVYDWP